MHCKNYVFEPGRLLTLILVYLQRVQLLKMQREGLRICEATSLCV